MVEPYGSTLDNCYISDNSDSIDSSDNSDSKQEQTCLQDFASVCISNRHNLGFGGPWVCVVLALVLTYTLALLVKFLTQLVKIFFNFLNITSHYFKYQCT